MARVHRLMSLRHSPSAITCKPSHPTAFNQLIGATAALPSSIPCLSACLSFLKVCTTKSRGKCRALPRKPLCTSLLEAATPEAEASSRRAMGLGHAQMRPDLPPSIKPSPSLVAGRHLSPWARAREGDHPLRIDDAVLPAPTVRRMQQCSEVPSYVLMRCSSCPPHLLATTSRRAGRAEAGSFSLDQAHLDPLSKAHGGEPLETSPLQVGMVKSRAQSTDHCFPSPHSDMTPNRAH